MRTLRSGDPNIPPLYCVHPVSGRSDDYLGLAGALAWPGSVLGFDAPASFDSLADIARQHCDALVLGRPVLLLGWSIGGVIAAEMSRVVADRGGTVAFLGLLDSRAPQPEMRQRPTDRDTLARFYLHQRALSFELTPAPPPATTDAPALLATLRSIGAAEDIADEHELERRLTTFTKVIRAFFQHEQLPVPVTLHLFETTESHPSHPRPATLGWDKLAPSVEKRSIPGTHFSLMAPSRSVALAQAIDAELPAISR